jgi:hypothetical protein
MLYTFTFRKMLTNPKTHFCGEHMGFELRAFSLTRKHSATWAVPPAPDKSLIVLRSYQFIKAPEI